MSKTALHDIQKTLNIIRNQIDAVDADPKWAALELMLASSTSAVAKKIVKSATKTVTRTISMPKTKIVKKPVKQTRLERHSSNCYQTRHSRKAVFQTTN